MGIEKIPIMKFSRKLNKWQIKFTETDDFDIDIIWRTVHEFRDKGKIQLLF